MEDSLTACYVTNYVMRFEDVTEDPDLPIVDQCGKDTNEALALFSIAGLSDANLYLRRPGELSDGQRYRFRLAKIIESGAEVWFADEFMAILDRVTAKCLAFNMQKIARRRGATLRGLTGLGKEQTRYGKLYRAQDPRRAVQPPV